MALVNWLFIVFKLGIFLVLTFCDFTYLEDTIKIDDLNDSNEKDSAIKLQKMVPS